MHTHAHIAKKFLFTVLILRKKCVYVSFCNILTALNSPSIVDRMLLRGGETQSAFIYFKVVLCFLCNLRIESRSSRCCGT